MNENRQFVAIGIEAKTMDRAVREILGMSIRSKKPVIVKPIQQTLVAKNIKIATQGFFQDFGLHIQSKVVKAFTERRDPATGKKWKKLSWYAASQRFLATESGRKARKEQLESAIPLYLTGKLWNVATGRNLKGLSGGLGRQRAGSLGKDKIQLTIYAGYKMNGPVQFGSYIWSLEGEKTRHNYGYMQRFENEGYGEADVYPVPARPFMPRFNSQFLSAFVRTKVNPRFRKSVIATQKGSEAMIGYAAVRVKDF
jgi:hypothetical protein